MIERRTYGLYELEGWLADFEHKYKLSSEEFYRLHLDDDVGLLSAGPLAKLPGKISRFDRHVWASYYREAKAIERRNKEKNMSVDLLDSDGPGYDPEAYAEGIDLARKTIRERGEYTGKLKQIRLVYGTWFDEVWVAGKKLDPAPSLELFNHSPDGFSWGYNGSGPAQLALAILLEVTGDPQLSVRLHQAFKADFVGTWPKSDFTTYVDVAAWIGENA